MQHMVRRVYELPFGWCWSYTVYTKDLPPVEEFRLYKPAQVGKHVAYGGDPSRQMGSRPVLNDEDLKSIAEHAAKTPTPTPPKRMVGRIPLGPVDRALKLVLTPVD